MNWDNVKNVTGDDESGRFVTVTNVNYLQDTTKSLANKRNSYVIVWSRQQIHHLKDWKTITQRKFNENGYLALMKKVNKNGYICRYGGPELIVDFRRKYRRTETTCL